MTINIKCIYHILIKWNQPQWPRPRPAGPWPASRRSGSWPIKQNLSQAFSAEWF